MFELLAQVSPNDFVRTPERKWQGWPCGSFLNSA